MNEPVFVIAEAGVNHNGDPALAYKLIDAAVAAGADAVKFQTFKADKLVTKAAPKADYQSRNMGEGGGQWQMLKDLELADDLHIPLRDYCRERNIEFLSTPFDETSLVFLVDEIGVERIKLSSGDIHNTPLLSAAVKSGLPIIVSTGMCDLGDIDETLGLIGCLLADPEATPGRADLADGLARAKRDGLFDGRVSLLHCTTEYPAPLTDVTLTAMDVMRDRYNVPVGYSDHTEGIAVPVAAVAMGATIIEKHFTLDRTMPGPDHKASLEPDELTEMVRSIRAVSTALGDGEKKPRPSEIGNIKVARRSLVALEPVAEGETFTTKNLGVRRPGDGRNPLDYWDVIDTTATKAYAIGDKID